LLGSSVGAVGQGAIVAAVVQHYSPGVNVGLKGIEGVRQLNLPCKLNMYLPYSAAGDTATAAQQQQRARLRLV
jgi:hypothetical protein